MALQTSDFDYPLDERLIAQTPAARREQSRLMVLRRRRGAVGHHVFADLDRLLRPGDLLVLNDTRVIPARFFCRRATGGKIEGLFCREIEPGLWEVMLKGAGRCKTGEPLQLAGCEGVTLVLGKNLGRGRWRLEPLPAAPAEHILAQAGSAPLPPYIHRRGGQNSGEDNLRYQTIYADRPGAVAAPTAGLHFTEDLMGRLTERGMETVKVTLHVGPGTFLPVHADDLADHEMHSEWYDLSADAAAALNTARNQRRRIVAVGTTSVRVLETVAGEAERASAGELFRPASGWTDIFIHPPADFRAVDALITNFHLPKSTLLMLVSAFCSPGDTGGTAMILNAYAQAAREEYRFYSYGDAMLIE